jgi:nicotinamide-nucleotide amidase
MPEATVTEMTDEYIRQHAAELGSVLTRAGAMLVTAESCTGGWVAKAMTDQAGSSAYVTGGLVTYSNHAKHALLGVSEKTLAEHGAVSEPVVRQMVSGALRVSGANVAVSISGVAGPGGGSDAKPVGTVWFGWGSAEKITTELRNFKGDRDQVRRQAVIFAIESVRRFLLSDL